MKKALLALLLALFAQPVHAASGSCPGAPSFYCDGPFLPLAILVHVAGSALAPPGLAPTNTNPKNLTVNNRPVKRRDGHYERDWLNVYDPRKEMAVDMGFNAIRVGASIALPGIGSGVGMVVGIPRCVERDARHQLQDWAREDYRLGKWWNEQNNTDNIALAYNNAVVPCLPVIGGLVQFANGINNHDPHAMARGGVGAVLDATSFGLVLPNNVTDPLSYWTQADDFMSQHQAAAQKKPVTIQTPGRR